MKRDSRGSITYWNQWISYKEKHIPEMWGVLRQTGGDEGYAPQYAFEIVRKHYELALQRYSRGDAVGDFKLLFSGLLDAWEESERLGEHVWTEEQRYMRHSWAVNLDHYIVCFWLTGLALMLEIPDDQWQRLVALIGNEGEDALLDRVIAFRQPERKIGEVLCFPKAYQGLLNVVSAPVDQRPSKLQSYVGRWFVSLKNAGSSSFPPAHRTPYWWNFCANEELGMKGAYFGCWCIEAVTVATVFDIDDAVCLDHPNYPGDLRKDNRCPRYPDPEPSLPPPLPPALKPQGWLSRLLGK
ncbi:PoNe immunity protein domain-containing protein [Dyella terrae]|uniref:PoNe immunity protein domain-containing protein n=1 Tax=Dyella terrae TaxID=522259 RepID=UPI001EFE24D4|nr:PoNe immunity protein domain-containing protein [Dyella terrae]ULU27707.1 DUF1911 protein [Dyella terrae]